MSDAGAWLTRAVELRGRQDMVAALEAIHHAAKLAPLHPDIALGLAQLSYEAGLPAADLFAQAAALAPQRLEIVRSRAIALTAEGEAAEGEAQLAAAVDANPGWIDGHRTLCGLRTTARQDDFARSFAAAVAGDRGNQALWLAWFHVLATARDWPAAASTLDKAEAALGDRPALRIARLFIASESGEAADEPALFDEVEGFADPGLDLARVRHFLRGGQVERAESVAACHLGQPSARAFLPYLSLAWRLLGDPRAQWLDRGLDFVRQTDLGCSPAQLAELAECLRAMHVAQAPFHEQSVRGGTQTERPLLLQVDPVILDVRQRIERALRDYVDALPENDPAHPLLSPPREGFRFSGSWSVRLRGQGFHSVHTHPMGWISSALYVAVPDAAARGPAPAGHLLFGQPPPELGLPVEPYANVAPEPGRLVLFPSTMWHGTAPFDDGERLTIAFDVVPAPRPA